MKTETLVTRFGNFHLPLVEDRDLTDKLRITWHWSAGSYSASTRAREHYNLLILKDGRIEEGVPIENQFVTKSIPRNPGIASHVLNANSNNIAISAMAMAESVEGLARQGEYGPYPITEAQMRSMIDVAALICLRYGIPVLPTRVLGHEEWDSVMGIRQDRWDVCCIPHLDIRPRLLPDGTYESTNYMRAQTKQRITQLTPPAATSTEPAMAEVNKNLRALYAAVKALPLSLNDQREATRGLNIFTNVLRDSGLKED